MKNIKIFSAIFLVFLFCTPATFFSQTSQLAIKKNAPKVFVDCQQCDINYLKEHIEFVNFVRDRNEADIHILISDQRTGSGGKMNTVMFFGKNNFVNKSDTLKYSVENFNSDDEKRQKLVHTLKMGLIQYISKLPIAEKIRISFDSKNEKQTKVVDEWNFWVYRFNLNSFLNGRESTDFIGIWTSLSANRVVENLKIKFALRGSYNESNFKFDNSEIKNISRSYGFYSSIIPSINEHWSWGVWASASSSTYRNINIGLSLGPGLEYNLFKYSESNDKQLRFTYRLSSTFNKYTEETVYFKTKEFLIEENLSLTIIFVKPWGTVSTTLSGENFMHDFSKNSLEIVTRVRLNLFKGFNLNIRGSYSRIHNQISLPRQNATLEEVLLQRRELETQYEYYGSIGISFTFGSIYNNIVNPRFGD